MNIYLIWQDVNLDYDTYRQAVVTAENEDAAQKTDPSGMYSWCDEYKSWVFEKQDGSKEFASTHDSWTTPDYVGVEKLGISDGNKPMVICSDFHAG